MYQPSCMLFVLLFQTLCDCIPLWFEKNPLNVWQNRVLYRNLTQLSVTEEIIDKAIYNYGQDSYRVWKFFQKILTGENVHMSVIGGSNSAGGGIPDHKELYHQLFLQWWNHAILPYTGSKLTVTNLSLGGTGSDFFSLCIQNYLLKCKQPDLVLIELSVNDYGYRYGDAAQPMEHLTRRMMSFSSKPLVIYVTLVDLIEKVKSLWWKRVLNSGCFNLEDLGQHEIARYYNITTLSWRDMVCPMAVNISKRDAKRRIEIKPMMINEDHVHIGVKSHAQIALMLTSYFQKMLRKFLCDPWKTKPSIDKAVPLFVSTETLISKPPCWSLISPDWRMSRESQSLQVKVLERRGFYEVTSQSTYAKMARTGADRSDSFGGWQSTEGGSFIDFFFSVPKNAGHTKKWSVGIILRHLQCGRIKIWLDENERKSLTITGNTYGRVLLQTRVHFLKTRIKSGDHKMQIKTEGRKGFEVLLSE